ncbi:rhodanese-like domain-containing protein [Aequorivita echinoideorum]|uniref:Rhodanese-like domain-containing protein n=1 Tax=Aequorivita echinoideorum TaxID=1549647 RepID=A0ABS5S2K4_9FLAO|nr:rhodanese-like domain-containing protein [Aequorivita echinoideorum]MBT0607442.1 rhodanese-like domain-containing protein [Aequorivita echinoideorum]
MKIIFALMMLFPFFGNAQKTLDELLQQYNTRSIPYISVEEARMLQMKNKSLFLDAREREEYDVSHIPNAEFVGYNTFSSEEISKKISDKSRPIIVYCSLGIRSEQIAEKMKKAGFTNIRNMYGGIFEWKNTEYPVEDHNGNKTENVHAFSKQWGKWLKKGIKIYDK